MDSRTDTERMLWKKVGPPLYYCSECLLAVEVTPVEGGESIVKRRCAHTGQIIAPRKSILAGKGGLNFKNKVQLAWWQLLAALTGRCA